MRNPTTAARCGPAAAALLAAAALSLALAATAGAAPGALTQKSGTAGCISETGSAGACTDGTALDQASTVTISPDGRNAYAASAISGSVSIFDRNTTTGALTQKPGTTGCISDDGSGGACVDGTALAGAFAVTVSPDGRNVYAVAKDANAIAIFDRDPTTGALTQKPGTAGCISNTGSAGACVDGTALDGAFSVTVSPDGKSVYAASFFSSAVSIFDRDPNTGALTQKPGTAGCISDDGSGGACTDGTALTGAFGVTVAPDGGNVYATGQGADAVTVFDRNTTTGALTQKPGTAGCISETGSAGACTDGTALGGAFGVTVSPDGSNVYVPAQNADAVAIFDRNATTGALTQKPGTAGCISETGTSGACTDGTVLDGARTVAIAPDGSAAYAAAAVSDAITVFDRDVPPQTTLDSAPSGLINDPTPTFTFSSDDPAASFQCSIDAGPFGSCSGPGAADTTAALADGPHSFAVRAVDSASTPDPTPASRDFTVDATGPKTTIQKGPKAKVKTKGKKAKVTVTFKSEAGAGFECRLDKAQFKRCDSPFKAKVKSKPGKGAKHTISIRATDGAGNVEGKPATVKFKVIRKE